MSCLPAKVARMQHASGHQSSPSATSCLYRCAYSFCWTKRISPPFVCCMSAQFCCKADRHRTSKFVLTRLSTAAQVTYLSSAAPWTRDYSFCSRSVHFSAASCAGLVSVTVCMRQSAQAECVVLGSQIPCAEHKMKGVALVCSLE